MPSTTFSAAGTRRLITKSGSAGALVLPNATGVGVANATSDLGYGSWGQLVASASAEYLLVGVSARLSNITAGQQGPIIVDIGSGGAGSETVLDTVLIFGSELLPTVTTSNYIGGQRDFTVPIRVPAGTRLAARAALTVASSSANSVTVVLRAVPYANLE